MVKFLKHFFIFLGAYTIFLGLIILNATLAMRFGINVWLSAIIESALAAGSLHVLLSSSKEKL